MYLSKKILEPPLKLGSSWVPEPQVRLGVRHFIDPDHGYLLVAGSQSSKNRVKLSGEILGSLKYETGNRLAPWTYQTMGRAVFEIEASVQQRIMQTISDAKQAVEINLAARNPSQFTPDQLAYYTGVQAELAERFSRARTRRRIDVGQRARKYADFRDSLRRLNWLIVSCQAYKMAQQLCIQVVVDEKSLVANDARLQFWLELSGQIGEDLELLLAIAKLMQAGLVPEQEAEWLLDVLEGLQVKPFCFAVQVIAEAIKHPGSFGRLGEVIEAAINAELELLNLEMAISAIKHDPEQQHLVAPLLGGFHYSQQLAPYRELTYLLSGYLGQAARTNSAKQLQKFLSLTQQALRYRTEAIWHGEHILLPAAA